MSGRKSRAARNAAVPDVRGTWHCQWFDDEGDPDNPKIEDTVVIDKWASDGRFAAVGDQPEFLLNYPITGEVDPSRLVTLEYRAANYPYEPNRGVACLLVSRDGARMEGKWYGRRSTGKLGGGRAVCTRIAAAPEEETRR